MEKEYLDELWPKRSVSETRETGGVLNSEKEKKSIEKQLKSKSKSKTIVVQRRTSK